MLLNRAPEPLKQWDDSFSPPEGVTPTPVESDDGAAPTIATAARGEGAVQHQQQQQQRAR